MKRKVVAGLLNTRLWLVMSITIIINDKTLNIILHPRMQGLPWCYELTPLETDVFCIAGSKDRIDCGMYIITFSSHS